MEHTMKISSSPHIRDQETIGNLMAQVIIALLPAAIFGIYNFGKRAFLIIILSIVSAVFFEYGYQYLVHKKITIYDGSAMLTGLLLALNLPSTVPFWIPILGSLFAIVVVKQLFGGLGQNFMNPTLGARCFLLISFTGHMTTFTYDSITTATPLTQLKAGETVEVARMFIGTTAGTIGETSAIALLIGGLYLIFRKVISYKIPFYYLFSFLVFLTIYALVSGKGFDFNFLTGHLVAGGLMLGAFFMATDYVTSPMTSNGKIIFGILLGFLTFLFRIFGASAGGVSYAIIFGNLLVPLIEKATLPKAFGKEGKKNEHGK